MNRVQRNRIILISALAVLLVGLICTYFFVVLPLLDEGTEETDAPPYVAPGEGLYNNTMITVYPEIDKNAIEYVEVTNKNGTYAFHKYFDSTMSVEEMRIKDHEKINHDESMFAVLLAYVRLPVSYQSHTAANAPMRDVSEEKMREYGVTEDTCQASYTVGYKKNGKMEYYTVYIGDASFTDEVTYYVALKGRNSIYRLSQEGVEDCMLVAVEDYLSPYIYGRYESDMIAMTQVERFKIGLSDPSKLGTDGYLESLIEVVKTGQNIDGTTNMYDLYYKSRGTGKVTRTGTNAHQLSAAFSALYTYFTGDAVVKLNPTTEELKAYGLSTEDACYFITAQLSEDSEDIYTYQISQLKDGYYYTLSTMFGEDNRMLIRVPEATLSFLGTSDEAVFEWAGTDVSSLFYEYLKKTEEEPGMYQLNIRVQKKNDVGEIIYDTREGFIISLDDRGGTIATQTSDGKKYETLWKNEDEGVNQFTNFYTMLIRLPAPWEFNNMTSEEIEALMADDTAVVFDLVARRNDDKVLKYTYYQIGNSVDVMIVTQEGHMDGGVVVWDEEPQISFNTTTSQIETIRQCFFTLINDGEIIL